LTKAEVNAMLAIRKPTTVEFGVCYCVVSFEPPLAVMQAGCG